jgi:exosortase E/protease (VPEID-CTERM system)
VNTPLSEILSVAQRRFGLLARLLVVLGFLAAETLLISGLIQGPSLDELTGAAKLTHEVQHWAFRFLIAYAGSFAILLYLRGARQNASMSAAIAEAPVSIRWLIVHALLLVPFALLSMRLYRDGSTPFVLLAAGWHAFGLAAAFALLAAVAPLKSWYGSLQRAGLLPAYALLPAAGALLAFKASQSLWGPAAALTFQLVRFVVQPFCPALISDPASLTLSTEHFSVQVSEVCSGLEGVGLMLVFCAAWLWYFRREYIFPRVLIVFPMAVLVIFLLNSLRIAALVLIGDAGHQQIAAVGFHSQAGWIAFNLAAFGVAFVARRSSWLSSGVPHPRRAAHDATAAYLMPLLAILAAGMIAHALSSGFDLWYPARLASAAIVLFIFRGSYRNLNWSFSWRGVAAGVAVFAVWAAFAHFLTKASPAPADLGSLSGPLRAAWISCRAAAAIITVPLAEELAYRGYLMRRILRLDFESLALPNVSFAAIAISAVVFGITHGSFWLPGIIAGLVYAVVAVKTGKIGESVAAHATTNSLIAVQVLLFGQWQLW